MARPSPSRMSSRKILTDLRLVGRRGDRSALTIAVDGTRTLAHSPCYWEKYLGLLRNPSARFEGAREEGEDEGGGQAPAPRCRERERCRVRSSRSRSSSSVATSHRVVR